MATVDETLGIVADLETRPYGEIKKGYTFFVEGDVLFAKITPCMQNGKHAVAQGLIDGLGFGSTEFHVLRPLQEATADWIHLFLRQPSVLHAATAHFTGAVGQQRVPEDYIADLRIPLPPLPEQERIVGILDQQMAAIERARAAGQRQLDDASALPAALLREVFPASGQPLPAGWRWAKLGELGWLTDGDWILNADYAASGVRLLQVGDVGVGRFVGRSSRYITMQRAEELGCTQLQTGDILISRMPDPIGRACILPELGYPSITAVDVSIFRPSVAKAHTGYLVAYFSSPDWFGRVLSMASGATRPRISRSNLESLSVPLPNLTEQKRIAGALSRQTATADQARLALEAMLADISALPATLLRRAFSGEL